MSDPHAFPHTRSDSLRRRGSVLLAVMAAASLALTGCQASAVPTTDDRVVVDGGGAGAEAESPGGDDFAEEMPKECESVSIGWYPGVDIADVSLMPDAWPAPPADSTLCSTSGGGSSETAAYASSLSIDEVFAHSESQFPADVAPQRFTGEENGTGYETLDGQFGDVGFQIRRNDGGFTLVFSAG